MFQKFHKSMPESNSLPVGDREVSCCSNGILESQVLPDGVGMNRHNRTTNIAVDDPRSRSRIVIGLRMHKGKVRNHPGETEFYESMAQVFRVELLRVFSFQVLKDFGIHFFD